MGIDGRIILDSHEKKGKVFDLVAFLHRLALALLLFLDHQCKRLGTRCQRRLPCIYRHPVWPLRACVTPSADRSTGRTLDFKKNGRNTLGVIIRQLHQICKPSPPQSQSLKITSLVGWMPILCPVKMISSQYLGLPKLRQCQIVDKKN